MSDIQDTTATEPIPFEKAQPIVPDRPLTQQLASNSGMAGLKRSFFEDDIITDDVYTTIIKIGDVSFYAREFTSDELKAFRAAAKRVAADMGLAEHLVYDAEAFNKALAALPPDSDGNTGMEQYALRMADTFNAVIDKHLRGWDFPHACTSEKKRKLWPSNKFEFCMNLAQLGQLSGEDAGTLKNS